MTDTPGPPPQICDVDPAMLTAPELTAKLENMFGWLGEVEAMPDDARSRAYDEATLDGVREMANALLAERRDRHSDEHAPRGG